jgi:hypothetical protein
MKTQPKQVKYSRNNSKSVFLKVRYNLYDRAPHHMDLDTQRKFYSYMPVLSKVNLTLQTHK